MTRKPTTPHKAPSLEDQIYDALRSRGWIIPQTDEDVMRTEVDIEHNPIPLPPELEDPSELLRKLFPITREVEPEPLHVEVRRAQPGEAAATQPQSLLECFRARTGWRPSVIASTLEVTPIFLSDLSRYRHVVPVPAQDALADRAAQRLPNVQRTDVVQVFAHASQPRVAAFRRAPYPETEPMTYAEMINHSGMTAEAQHFWRSLAEKEAE
jgi:hypothetical protein